MVEEYSLYYDQDKTKKVGEYLEFPVVDAGTNEVFRLFIQNNVGVPLNLNVTLIGKSVRLMRYPQVLKAKETGELAIEVKTKITQTAPEGINAQLDIKTEFVM